MIDRPEPQSMFKVDLAPACSNLNIGLYVCDPPLACRLQWKDACALWGDVASGARSLILDAKSKIGTTKLKKAIDLYVQRGPNFVSGPA